MTLTAADFPAFFRAVHCFDPFPWQTRLAAEIAGPRRGRWPAVLALPTSAGKTCAIDVAVFLLALEVEKEGPRPVTQRSAAVRTFFVVDRRIVVDEAGERAKKLAGLLNDPPEDADPVLREVARRLRAF